MNLLFMGTPDFAKIILEELCKDSFFNIVGLVTQSDKPYGRKMILKPSSTKLFVLENKLSFPIYHLDSNAKYEFLKELQIDVILVVAYGNILPQNIIDNYFCINIHASILPYYRGASPIQSMILNANNYVGISIIKMTKNLDDGDILSIRFIENKQYDIVELNNLLAFNGAALAIETLKNLNSIRSFSQFHCDATYCNKIQKSDGCIDFVNAKEIYRKFLAYKTWPNIFCESGLKLIDISLHDDSSSNKKGIIIDICLDYIIVGCIKGSLRIYLLQPPSKKVLSSISYLRGKRLKLGDIFN